MNCKGGLINGIIIVKIILKPYPVSGRFLNIGAINLTVDNG
jgi:hypothetical protein